MSLFLFRCRPNTTSMKLVLAVLLLLSVLVSPSAADLLTWNLNDVTLSGGGIMTGNFVYDTVSLACIDWNLTVAGVTNPVTLQPGPVSNSVAAMQIPSSAAASFDQYVYVDPPTPDLTGWYYRIVLNCMPGSGLFTDSTSDPMLSGYFMWERLPGMGYSATVIGGQACPTPVPPPPSAILFGSGLLGLVGWRRLKKN